MRDAKNYCYLGPAEKIHALLDVDLYVPVVPLAPLEELHASSVQHPRFEHMRWLLNTRRVPVLESTAAGARTAGEAAEPDKPACAGIGDTEKAAWLCHECASHLCRPRPRMPPQALANWNWGGREHPRYQNLSMATRSLLGLGRLVMRMVLLKPYDDSDESEKAIVGNTILVAQPSPQLIAAQLPPTEAEQASYFNVVYGSGAAEHGPHKLARKKALVVDREE